MAAKKHTLLFVDDEEDIISSLYDTFADDYNIFKTTNPEEAVEIVKKENISLVISDQRMPEMTGSEFLAKVNEEKPETIRILLTGYADINAAIDAVNNGAIHKYVEKPWDDDNLQEMVAGLVEVYQESKEQLSLLSDIENVMQNETSFREILNNIKNAVCTMDEEGSIHFANTSALKILGYETAEELSSKKIFTLGKGEIDEFRTEFKENQKVKAKILSATAKDKSSIDVLFTPVFDTDDEVMVGAIFQSI